MTDETAIADLKRRQANSADKLWLTEKVAGVAGAAILLTILINLTDLGGVSIPWWLIAVFGLVPLTAGPYSANLQKEWWATESRLYELGAYKSSYERLMDDIAASSAKRASRKRESASTTKPAPPAAPAAPATMAEPGAPTAPQSAHGGSRAVRAEVYSALGALAAVFGIVQFFLDR